MQTRVLVQTEMKTQGKSVAGLRNRYGRVVPFVYFDAPADANGHTFAQHRLSLFLFLWGEFNWLPRTATEQMPGRQTGLPAFVEQDAGLQKKQNTGPRPGPQAQRTAAGGSRLAT